MISALKTITIKMMVGANMTVVLLMLMVGYADHINPVDHPLLACAGLAFPVFLLLNLGFLLFWLVFQFRMFVIPVVGYALVFPSIHLYVPLNAERELPEGCIKVMSYNVQSFSGYPKYSDGFEPICDYIREADADILCLQEDQDARHHDHGRLDSLYAYRDTLGMGSPGKSNAIGIYSRYPILKKERIHYQSRANGSMAYFLKIGADTVIVVNNHLESNHLTLTDRENYRELLKGGVEKDSARLQSRQLISKLSQAVATRAPQADAVAAFIEEHRKYPIIVCGDFNDSPISYAHRTIAKGLTDCFEATGKGFGLSFKQQGFWVRIDNILCSEHFEPYNCKIDNKIDASDHYPIICWLKKR